MAPSSQYYIPATLHRDDMSIVTGTNSTFSTLGGAPGPGRTVGRVFGWLGGKMEDGLSRAAERLGFGINARMHRLLLTLKNTEWERMSIKERTPSCAELTERFMVTKCTLHVRAESSQMMSSATRRSMYLKKTCNKLMKYAR